MICASVAADKRQSRRRRRRLGMPKEDTIVVVLWRALSLLERVAKINSLVHEEGWACLSTIVSLI